MPIFTKFFIFLRDFIKYYISSYNICHVKLKEQHKFTQTVLNFFSAMKFIVLIFLLKLYLLEDLCQLGWPQEFFLNSTFHNNSSNIPRNVHGLGHVGLCNTSLNRIGGCSRPADGYGCIFISAILRKQWRVLLNRRTDHRVHRYFLPLPSHA